MDRLGRPRTDILGYTMPGFATGEATKANARALMTALGVTPGEIDIRPAARQMLADLGHPFASGEPVYDVTFENVQAGLRTDYLFRLANRHDGFVLGTGDLSELALGWCTYGVGDQMSHYAVNAGVPKTLIQYLIRWAVKTGQFDAEASALLTAILATEISPELVPADASGKMQSTEARVGPYELHDFFLHYVVRHGLRPSKIAFLAWHAWKDRDTGLWPIDFQADGRHDYDLATIARWLETFLFRFFQTSQFKRSAIPNGPKVSAGGGAEPAWRLARAVGRGGGAGVDRGITGEPAVTTPRLAAEGAKLVGGIDVGEGAGRSGGRRRLPLATSRGTEWSVASASQVSSASASDGGHSPITGISSTNAPPASRAARSSGSAGASHGAVSTAS